MNNCLKWLGGSALALGVAGAVALVPSVAVAREEARSFDIPSQPLSAALVAFSRQSGEMIIASPDASAGRKSNAVRGTYPVHQAIDMLLSGSDLQARPTREGGYVIERAPRTAMRQTIAYRAAVAQPAPVREPEAAPASAYEEILVTAQRREERLQDVPLTVAAVSGDALASARVSEVRDLEAVTSGLLIKRIGSNVNPIIRGIGSSVSVAGSDTNVAIYLDGVIQPVPSNNAIEFNNLERIEVLKGPQGTLFGRNATGGAINIITKTPSYDTQVEANAGYGSFNELRGDLYATTGLGGNVAADIAVTYKQDDGYIRNLGTGNKIGDAKSFSIRGKVLLEASEQFKVVASYGHTYRYDSHGLVYQVLNGTTSARVANPGVAIATKRDEATNSVDPFATAHSDQGIVTATWDTGSTQINSITSYSDYNSYVLSDQDGTADNIQSVIFYTHDKIFTQDVNLNSSLTDSIDLLAGASYYTSTTRTHLEVFGASLAAPYFIRELYNKTTALAGFAELTWKITPDLTLIGGLRYATEKKRYLQTDNFGGYLPARGKFSGWSPRASLRYAVSPEANVYLTYSRGFKSGLVDLTGAAPLLVRPEINDSIEGGIKYASGGLRFNAAAYHYWYKDIQVSSFASNVGLPSIQNAASAHIWGLEADMSVEVTDKLKLSGGFAYNHARFQLFAQAPTFQPQPNGANLLTIRDLEGTKLPRAPDFTANATVSYREPINNGSMGIALTGNYNDGFAWNPDNSLMEGSYFVLNGQVDWTSESGIKVAAWIENITNVKYSLQTNESATANLVLWSKPRRYGVTIGAKF